MIDNSRLEYIKENMDCSSPYDLAMDMFCSCLTQEFDDTLEVATEIFSDYPNKDTLYNDVVEAHNDHQTMFQNQFTPYNK